jgi:hypothetical protein
VPEALNQRFFQEKLEKDGSLGFQSKLSLE